MHQAAVLLWPLRQHVPLSKLCWKAKTLACQSKFVGCAFFHLFFVQLYCSCPQGKGEGPTMSIDWILGGLAVGHAVMAQCQSTQGTVAVGKSARVSRAAAEVFAHGRVLSGHV